MNKDAAADAPHGFGYAVRKGLDAFDADAVAIMMVPNAPSVRDLRAGAASRITRG